MQFTAISFYLSILKSKSKTNINTRAYDLVLILVLDFDSKVYTNLKKYRSKNQIKVLIAWILCRSLSTSVLEFNTAKDYQHVKLISFLTPLFSVVLTHTTNIYKNCSDVRNFPIIIRDIRT